MVVGEDDWGWVGVEQRCGIELRARAAEVDAVFARSSVELCCPLV